MVKGDSTVSSPYWQEVGKHVLLDVTHIISPSVLLPNREKMEVTSQGQLPLSDKLYPQQENDDITPIKIRITDID